MPVKPTDVVMSVKPTDVVMPAQAGIQQFPKTNQANSNFFPQPIGFSKRVSMLGRMDASLRWHDSCGWRLFILALALFLLSGCQPQIYIDINPPHIVDISPSDFIVSVSQSFNIQFSEDIIIDPTRLKPVAIVRADEVDEEFLGDFKNAPLNKKREGKLIDLVIELTAPNMLKITPKLPLASDTKYLILLSPGIIDKSNNPLVGLEGTPNVIQYEFKTDVEKELIKVQNFFDDKKLAPDQNKLQFKFSRPASFSKDEITLKCTDCSEVPAVKFVSIGDDRKNVSMEFERTSAGHIWQPNSEYTLSLRPQKFDDSTSRELVEIAFKVGPELVSSGIPLKAISRLVPADKTANLEIVASRAGLMKLWFHESDNSIPCAGLPCPLVSSGEPNQIEQTNSPLFKHEIIIKGLVAEKEYDYVVSFRDEYDRALIERGRFKTVLLPKIAINEVMLNPVAKLGGSEREAEYIELVNYDEKLITFENYSLEISKKNGKKSVCKLPAFSMNAGDYVLIVSSGFKTGFFADISKERMVFLENKNLCGGLPNNSLESIAFKDSKDRTVSVLSIPQISSIEGRSIERTSPNAEDISSSFCYSRVETGPSPGRINSVTLQGCGV